MLRPLHKSLFSFDWRTNGLLATSSDLELLFVAAQIPQRTTLLFYPYPFCLAEYRNRPKYMVPIWSTPYGIIKSRE